MRNPEREASRENRVLGRVPFRRKIDMLVVLPTLAMAGLLFPVGVHEVGAARAWSESASYLDATKPIGVLIQDLAVERDKAQMVLGGAAPPAAVDDYLAAVSETDRQVRAAQGALDRNAPPAAAAALESVSELSYVRTQTPQVRFHQASVATLQDLVNVDYDQIMQHLIAAIDLRKRAALGGPAVTIESELAALYYADLAESQREAALAAFANTTNADNALLDYTTALQTGRVAADQRTVFKLYASRVDLAALQYVESLDATAAFDDYQTRVGRALANDLGPDHGAKEAQAVGKQLDFLRTGNVPIDVTKNFVILSDHRAAMERNVTDSLVALAQQNARTATLTLYALFAIVAGTFLVLLGLSVAIRHSVVRPVLRLTRAATRVAQAAAEDLERVADEDPGQHTPMPEFEPLPVPTGDELGELAAAFNQVQETALLVLERQITIRRNTAEMFGNVGHRIHNLTDRQLSLIDQVERTETDPALLDRMYRIDHLAVRLQRGADSLVLLSGEREASVGGAPMRLTDVVRSAVGRVEGYQRVVLIAEDDAMVVPASVGDLTLMIAELVDNAVSFSPATSRVEIAVGLTQRGFAIEVVDRGMGMTQEDMARENNRLIRRERLDLSPTRVLGLFVVGRLAQRTGVSVELTPTPGGGTTARIFVPGFLLAGTPQDEGGARMAGILTREPAQPPFSTHQQGELLGAEPMRRRAIGPAPSIPQPSGPQPPESYPPSYPQVRPPSQPNTPSSPQAAPTPYPHSQPTPAQFTPVPEPRKDSDPLPRRRRGAPAVEESSADTVPDLTVPMPPLPPFPTIVAPLQTPQSQQPPPSHQTPESAPSPISFPPLSQDPPTVSEKTNGLPRRVRNTNFAPRPEWPTADHLSAAAPAPHLDAVAVRAALEEYEAGVEQALRDSSDDVPTRRRSQARHAGEANPWDGDNQEKETKP